MVLAAQVFVNSTYGDKIGMTVDEDGQTGWDTMYALTRALQWELGITTLASNFGPGTLSALTAQYPVLNSETVPSSDFCKIIQSAMYCKGYDGGSLDGTYSARVEAGITQIKTDMGVIGTNPGGDLTPKVFKAMLNMDAYVTVNSGSPDVRYVQQWLNGRYADRQDYFIIPCDGHNSRDVSKALLLAVQYELGMADGVANGVFGPGTQAGLKSHTLSQGSTGDWVALFTGSMLLAGRSVAFTSTFDAALASGVRTFQSFSALPVTGNADFPTWASLLISYGDQSRHGSACDCVTKITSAKAATLQAQGITHVGRYLTNPSPTSLPEKAIQPGELQTLADNGFHVFPIYQTYGRGAEDFDYANGRAAGQAAVNAAYDHGFKEGTRIYFAVDFDALDQDITESVLPHFKGIEDALADNGNAFQVGIYGPRNVCSRVAAAGHSTASFVSDMSSGFSGNFGYTLPDDWAFDQFVTRSVGSGDGSISIDVDVVSGRDNGQASFNTPAAQVQDSLFDQSYFPQLLADVQSYMESIGFAEDDGKIYTTTECLSTIIAADVAVSNTARAYSMRKALIQTTAFWEFKHYGNEDLVKDAGVWLYHNGYIPDWAPDVAISAFRDSSTGVAQMFGVTGVLAWNNSINTGLVVGETKDPNSDGDIFSVWDQIRTDNDFAVTSVGHAHIWAADGKPGSVDAEEAMGRRPCLDYTDSEIYEVLRRYQGNAEPAFTDAYHRMPLYYIFEKYNRMMR
jgi:peptidoglycan hydrolase-like protein with peptidoglycan-binding domain